MRLRLKLETAGETEDKKRRCRVLSTGEQRRSIPEVLDQCTPHKSSCNREREKVAVMRRCGR